MDAPFFTGCRATMQGWGGGSWIFLNGMRMFIFLKPMPWGGLTPTGEVFIYDI